MLVEVKPIINLSVRGLCSKPYPGHPKGCPNFDMKPGCPPGAPPLNEVFDLKRPVYLVYNRFNLAQHVVRLQGLHPNWSERQLTCCLYWQGTARRQLRDLVSAALLEAPADYVVLTCPEAHGVNVTATMQAAGVNLEWPPKHFAYQVALLGVQEG